MSNSREAVVSGDTVRIRLSTTTTTKKACRRGEKNSKRKNELAFTDWFSIRPNILQLFILTSIANGLANGMQCFSCHGDCHSERRCNCQTGMCDGDYCFTERWARDSMSLIYKGCGKGRPRIGTMSTCEFQRLKERAFCICNDEDYCNEWSASSPNEKNTGNVTCWHCSGGSCSSKCNDGDYCVADLNRNQYTCAYGQPVLPFHYQGRELQQTYVKPWPACAAFRAGPHYNAVECACTNPICNDPKNLRDHLYFDDPRQPLLQCHSCAEEMLSEQVLPTCRRQTCLGHFCAIKVESVFDPLISAAASGGGSGGSAGGSASGGGSSSGSTWTKSFRYKQWSGCLNTTRPESVLKGTFQRWTVGTRQVTECVCRKDYCNLDIKLCMRAAAVDRRVSMVQIFFSSFFFSIMLWNVRL